MLTSIALVTVVLAVVLLLGVGAGWLVAAYDFPGRAWLSWALVLPLSMPAFVLAYAYTDFLDTSGPLQTTLRALTGWSVRGYWFPDIRSLPGPVCVWAWLCTPTSTCWRGRPSPNVRRRCRMPPDRWACRRAPPGGG
jgi:iron(III) transport system permease protein